MIYELYGRLAEEQAMVVDALANEAAKHCATVDILRRVVNGDLPVERVTVEDHNWRVTPGPSLEIAAEG